jgi:hypothetical protein
VSAAGDVRRWRVHFAERKRVPVRHPRSR